ncbi:hypothetical protein EGR_09806 [Echinococcus granulosus]|uniref:Uncharacterized protein n=1 Tax=Echinococcus granulosus TaxID=6210 RepID=W6U2N5_ECHGR|nr:hypothetical protein EGR_09806 [Echinococcus granulosus]EUB55338.1 hypothetical protein EGR_09806 [Echinococcus granulosus]
MKESFPSLLPLKHKSMIVLLELWIFSANLAFVIPSDKEASSFTYLTPILRNRFLDLIRSGNRSVTFTYQPVWDIASVCLDNGIEVNVYHESVLKVNK